jgi:hypothetical protein
MYTVVYEFCFNGGFLLDTLSFSGTRAAASMKMAEEREREKEDNETEVKDDPMARAEARVFET